MNETDLKTADLINVLRDTSWLENERDLKLLTSVAATRLAEMQAQLDEVNAEVDRLRKRTGYVTKMIKPEPSRLEIAAMFMAGTKSIYCVEAALMTADDLVAAASKWGAK